MLLLLLFGAVVLTNVLFFIRFSKFSLTSDTSNKEGKDYPVSVIVCAKNEAENLLKNIPYILYQDHSDFEVILINDASTDNTQEVIDEFVTSDSRVKSVHIENNEAFWSNKKYSLTLGIKKAKNHRLLFTDADCQPATDQWIRLMTTPFSEERQLVLGYGGYLKKKGLLNQLIRFETVMTAIQYFSHALSGMPYMGVGRNLAYTSKLFYDNSGFMSHMNVRSGDDDLFVNQAATVENTCLVFQKEAFTYSAPKESWKAWIHQKKRHITTAAHYKPRHKTILGLYYFSNLMFWILMPLCFIFLDWKIPLTLLVFRFALVYMFVGKGFKLLEEKELVPFLPLYELFLILIQLTIFISNSISKPTRWK